MPNSVPDRKQPRPASAVLAFLLALSVLVIHGQTQGDGPPLSNQDVKVMVSQGVSTEAILAVIRSKPVDFDTR